LYENEQKAFNFSGHQRGLCDSVLIWGFCTKPLSYRLVLRACPWSAPPPLANRAFDWCYVWPAGRCIM